MQQRQAYLKKLYPNFNYDKEAKTFILKQSETIQNKGMIVVVCAGTSDIPIAREAVLTAEFLGNEVNLISDVGVAGIHRLFNKMDGDQQSKCYYSCSWYGRGFSIWVLEG